jgi:LytS/YehU family sensor histidine kinase
MVVVPLALLYAFVCLSAWYVAGATPIRSASLGRVLAAQSGSAVLAVAVWGIAWEGWTLTLSEAYPDSVDHYRGQFPLIVAAGLLLFGLAAMFHYLLIAFEDSRRAETRELGLEVMAREAELKALRSQIDPHFLFNSLHSVSALTSTDPAGARRMCLLLADFFRSSVRLGAEDKVDLDQELEMIRQYLDIERVRCGARLSATIEVEPGCGTCRIPPLILQPLIENSVRHGINSLVEGGSVTIRAGCGSGTLRLEVENPVDADAPRTTGAGVGLSNVKRRLDTLFGNQSRTRITRDRGMFRVELQLPCPHDDTGGRR